MCWITLSPRKKATGKGGGKHHHHHDPHDHHSAASDCSSAEIVRIRHAPSPRFSELNVKLPASVVGSHHDDHHHGHHHSHDGHHHHDLHPPRLRPLPHGLLSHHHRHPHLHIHTPHHHHPHPLHQHPPSPEKTYRTQIVVPTSTTAANTSALRNSTRSALRSVRSTRKRSASANTKKVRVLGGYEILREKMPWDWECVSSVGSKGSGGDGEKDGNGKKKGKGEGEKLPYPPFDRVEGWM